MAIDSMRVVTDPPGCQIVAAFTPEHDKDVDDMSVILDNILKRGFPHEHGLLFAVHTCDTRDSVADTLQGMGILRRHALLLAKVLALLLGIPTAHDSEGG